MDKKDRRRSGLHTVHEVRKLQPRSDDSEDEEKSVFSKARHPVSSPAVPVLTIALSRSTGWRKLRRPLSQRERGDILVTTNAQPGTRQFQMMFTSRFMSGEFEAFASSKLSLIKTEPLKQCPLQLSQR